MTPGKPESRDDFVSVYEIVRFLARWRVLILSCLVLGILVAIIPTILRTKTHTLVAKIETAPFEAHLIGTDKIKHALSRGFSGDRPGLAFAQTFFSSLDGPLKEQWSQHLGGVQGLASYGRVHLSRYIQGGGAPHVDYQFLVNADALAEYSFQISLKDPQDGQKVYLAAREALSRMIESYNEAESERRKFYADVAVKSNQESLNEVLKLVSQVGPKRASDEKGEESGLTGVYDLVAEDLLKAMKAAHPSAYALPRPKSLDPKASAQEFVVVEDRGRPPSLLLVIGAAFGLAAGVILSLLTQSYLAGRPQRVPAAEAS